MAICFEWKSCTLIRRKNSKQFHNGADPFVKSHPNSILLRLNLKSFKMFRVFFLNMIHGIIIKNITIRNKKGLPHCESICNWLKKIKLQIPLRLSDKLVIFFKSFFPKTKSTKERNYFLDLATHFMLAIITYFEWHSARRNQFWWNDAKIFSES